MFKFNPKPKTGLIIFISLAIIIFGQAVWWIAFLATVVAEKIDIAASLGADQEYLDAIREEEITHQVIIGTEGVFFLLLVLFSSWLIYRTLARTEKLKFHQQNFLMAVTHELKTPLASIKIYVDSLRSPKISPDKKATVLPRIKENADRLEKLVENILDAGRFERSGYRLDKEELNLTALMQSCLEKVSKIPSKEPVEINQQLEEGVVLYADALALDRAIAAILENCLIYHDKEKIIIDVKLSTKHKMVEIIIADNGIGLKRKDTTEIFNRFYRVGDEMRRSKPGTGLGLYLAREIVRAHKGKITAKSNGPGMGTSFHLKLKRGSHVSGENNPAG